MSSLCNLKDIGPEFESKNSWRKLQRMPAVSETIDVSEREVKVWSKALSWQSQAKVNWLNFWLKLLIVLLNHPFKLNVSDEITK